MGKIKLGLLLLLMTLVGTPMTGYGMQLSESELYARSACLMDADSGRVLYSKNSEQKLPMASTTKIMTCILALEDGRMDDLVTVSAYAASQPKVHMGAKTGEQFYLQDLLYALMLNSDNDAAVMIAEQVGGSVEGFAEKMNLKARELGCDDTYFITPNGLDAENKNGIHSTTAKDLARILRYCIMESPKKAEFLAITQMPAYTFWNYSKTQIYQCTNHNAFLGMMDGALTGKTLIVSLLACGWPNNRGYKWEDTRKLMTYGLTNYEYRDVFEQKDLGRIAVLNGRQQGTTIDEVATTSLEYGSDVEQMHLSLLLRKDEQITVHYQLPPQLEAPVRKGQQIGVAQYFLGKELLQEYPIYAGEQVDVRDYYWCLEQIGAAYCA